MYINIFSILLYIIYFICCAVILATARHYTAGEKHFTSHRVWICDGLNIR